MQNLTLYFFTDFNYKSRTLLFKRLLWVYLLIKCVYWLIYYDFLFGENSIISLTEFTTTHFYEPAFFLNHPANSTLSLWAIFLIAALCLLNIFNRFIPYIFDFVLWLAVLNVHSRIYSALSGGELLLNQLLFYCIFISTRFSKSSLVTNQIKICIHNFGIIAVIIHVCVLYLISGIFKLNDALWLNGNALSQIAQIKHYTISSAFGLKPSLTSSALNYIVLFYQLLFPALIWVKKIKKPLLVLGIIIHLYIAFIMGLMSFGILMMISYVYFWPRQKHI